MRFGATPDTEIFNTVNAVKGNMNIYLSPKFQRVFILGPKNVEDQMSLGNGGREFESQCDLTSTGNFRESRSEGRAFE